jgi:hypothetical protein
LALEITSPLIVKENNEMEQSSCPTDSPSVAGSSDEDPTRLESESRALREQMFELMTGENSEFLNKNAISDIMDKIETLNHRRTRREREAAKERPKVHVRYFYMCLDEWSSYRCMKIISSDAQPTPMTSTGPQRWYCECGKRFNHHSKIVVEIRQGEKHWYVRAPRPDIDMLSMQDRVRRQQLVNLTPIELHARLGFHRASLVHYSPMGLDSFDTYNIFMQLQEFQWDEIFHVKASME